MGVKDLWQLLSPVGRRVSIETLEGKILAIDASIWITQFIKAMRDEEGMMRNAHIIGTIRRILRLLFHKIRPVFVFDGKSPELKWRTLQSRRRVREKGDSDKKFAARKILLQQLKKASTLAARPINQVDAQVTMISAQIAAQESLKNSSSSSTVLENVPGEASGGFLSEGEAAVTHVKSNKSESEGDDVEWEESLDIKAKPLDETEDVADTDVTWNLPDDPAELDVDMLAALPDDLRKDIFEEAHRRDRVKRRAAFIPVAHSPNLYSQTQLANFLKKRFREILLLL